MLCIFAGVMGVAIAAFLGFHLYLVWIGQTTNETHKWSQILNAHKRLLTAYEEQNGLKKESPSWTGKIGRFRLSVVDAVSRLLGFPRIERGESRVVVVVVVVVSWS